VDNEVSGVEMVHNIVVTRSGQPVLIYYLDDALEYYWASGSCGGNIIDSMRTAGGFVTFSPSTLTYDMMLTAGAPAIGAGVATGAPQYESLAVARTAPYDAGGYAYRR
jgi:hypothetical protein